MDKKQKNILLALTCVLVFMLSVLVGIKVISPLFNGNPEQPGVVITTPPDNPNPEDDPEKEEKKQKEYIPIVFIGKNSSGEEVYKVVKREYDKDVDGSKLRHAVTSLILGPKQTERNAGIYSEVPTSTTVLHVYDNEDKVIIDLSSGFVYGAGTESVYKRLFQLIKTVNRNTDKPAYLYIDGKQADVIGGDGIMITQPLSEQSIGE